MRNSLLWLVSAVLSAAAHYGLIAAAASIPLPAGHQEQLAEIVLGGEAFQPVALDAGSAAAALDTSGVEKSAELPEVKVDAVAAAFDESASIESTVTTAPVPEQPAAGQLPSAEVATLPQANDSGQIDQSGAGDVASAAAAPDLGQAGDNGSGISVLPQETQLATAPDAADGLAPLSQPAGTSPAAAPAAGMSSSGDAATLSASEAPSTDDHAAAGASAASQTLSAESPSGGTGEIAAEPNGPAPVEVASAATSTTQTMSQAERVAQFMENHGQGCMLAAAAQAGGARPLITGLGGEGPAGDFAAAFRKSVGVDPGLALALVRDAQCPAVDFIRDMGGPSREMKIVLDHNSISNGDMLIGHIENPAADSVQLLLVDDDGGVLDITNDFHQLPKGNVFAKPMRVSSGGRGRNQLVLAISSAKAMEISVSGAAGEAKRVFDDIIAASERSPIPVAIAYAAFRIE